MLLAAVLALALVGCQSTGASSVDGGLPSDLQPDRPHRPDGDAGAPGPELSPTGLELLAPGALRPGEPVPIVVRALHGDTAALHFTGVVQLTVDGGTVEPGGVKLIRGVGSVLARVSAPGEVVTLVVSHGELSARARLVLGDPPSPRELSGLLAEEDLAWGPDQEVRVAADLRVPEGRSLRIGPGTRVRLGPGANLIVSGSLEVDGSPESPVTFSPLDQDSPWGGVVLGRLGGRLAHAILHGGGGDPARVFGHSGSQPVIFVDGGELSLDGCVLMDNPGKGLGSSNARVTMRRCLVTRCDTGGELDFFRVEIRDSHFLEMPGDDGVRSDDDNDGIYLHGPYPREGQVEASLMEDTVFAVGKDDGIDHNGATVLVRGCFVEGFHNEGIACSNGGRISIMDTLVTACGQGVEAGYGAPEVLVDHCTLVDNGVGLRYGDSYDWEVDGWLTVTSSISVSSSRHNVWNFVRGLDGPREDRLSISGSMVDDPAWDGRNGNVPGLPALDATFHMEQGSPGSGAAADGLDPGLLR